MKIILIAITAFALVQFSTQYSETSINYNCHAKKHTVKHQVFKTEHHQGNPYVNDMSILKL